MAYSRLKSKDMHLELKEVDTIGNVHELYDGVPEDTMETDNHTFMAGAYRPLRYAGCEEGGELDDEKKSLGSRDQDCPSPEPCVTSSEYLNRWLNCDSASAGVATYPYNDANAHMVRSTLNLNSLL